MACLCDAKIGVRSGLICQSQFAIGQNAIIIIISHISNDIYFRLRARAINVQGQVGLCIGCHNPTSGCGRHNIPSLCDVIGLFPCGNACTGYGGFSPLVQVVITVMKIMTVWGVYFSNITRCEFAIWRCKRRYGHSHSHNTGDCEGEKTLAEFLHNRFLQSERNLYRVCFGTFGFAGGSDFVLSGLFCLGAQTCIGNSHSDEAVKNHKKQAKRRNHATLPRLAVGGNCARANAV